MSKLSTWRAAWMALNCTQSGRRLDYSKNIMIYMKPVVTVSLASQTILTSLRAVNKLVPECLMYLLTWPPNYPSIYPSIQWLTIYNFLWRVKECTLPLRWNWRERNSIGRKKPRLTASPRFGKLHLQSPSIKGSLDGSFFVSSQEEKNRS